MSRNARVTTFNKIQIHRGVRVGGGGGDDGSGVIMDIAQNLLIT